MKKYNLTIEAVSSNSWRIDGSEIVLWTRTVNTNSVIYLWSRICSFCPDGRLCNCKYNLLLNGQIVSFEDIYYLVEFKKEA